MMLHTKTMKTSLLPLGLLLSLGSACEGGGGGDGTTSEATGTTAEPTTTGGPDTGSSSGSTSAAETSAVDSSSGTTSDTGIACEGGDPRPTARGEIEGVWDAPRGRMVFFGGDQGVPVTCMSQTDFVGETWAFRTDCDEFDVLADGAQGPPARGRYAMAHDVGAERMFVHGGRFRAGTMGTYTLFDDTWAFDLTTDTWSLIDAVGPSPRTNHVAVVAGNQLLVFGGNASNNGLAFTPLDDLWALDLDTQTWEELPSAGGPSARLFHTAAVSADGTTMFVYGGGDQNAFTGPFFDDLWAYDIAGGAWGRIDESSPTAPIGSIWGDLLFDAPGDRLLLWGAHEDNLLGNNNKLWSFDLGAQQWTMLEEGDVLTADAAGFCDFPVDFVDPDLEAPERRNAGAAVLTDAGEVLVFGGKTDCGIIDDVWGWSTAEQTWNNRVRATSGEICVRAFAEGCQTMCF